MSSSSSPHQSAAHESAPHQSATPETSAGQTDGSSYNAGPYEAGPYDALLLVSFGGPEGPDDVLPFLENVTRGRGIPRERLIEVGEHYAIFGGVSPINAQNRELLAALRADFAATGLDLPIYWGNRNWQPYLSDALAEMTRDGVRRAAVFVTSAYPSYSGCRQYRENLADALESWPIQDPAPQLDKLRHYFNEPGFVQPMVDNLQAALATLPADVRDGAVLAFTTHSIPVAQAEASGPDGGAYVATHLEAAELVAAGVQAVTGVTHDWRLVFQSRSGPPSVPWLEPDVNDAITELHDAGASAVVLVPVGFVSDHVEVLYDLDVEAAKTAADLGLPLARAATVGTSPKFVTAIRELLLERAATERAANLGEKMASRPLTSKAECLARRMPGDLLPESAGAPPGYSGGRAMTVDSRATAPSSVTPELLEELRGLAVDVAARAATFLVSQRPADLRVSTKSSPTDVVTEMDSGAERLLVDAIRSARPDDGFLGEEGAAAPGTSGVRWVLDPIDGTVNYLYGSPLWAVSVAAEVDGRTVVGVVHAPAMGETFVGVLGGGATCNGSTLEVNTGVDLEHALVGTGFAYTPEMRASQGIVAGALVRRVRDLRRSGSAALDVCWVACGRLDAYYERTVNRWDVAAAGIIAAEAGADVSGLAALTATSDLTIAVSPGCADDLRDALVASGLPTREAAAG